MFSFKPSWRILWNALQWFASAFLALKVFEPGASVAVSGEHAWIVGLILSIIGMIIKGIHIKVEARKTNGTSLDITVRGSGPNAP